MKRAIVTGAACALAASFAKADAVVPPWSDPGDLPVPSWARSVAPRKDDVVLYASPGKTDVRRGAMMAGARLPLFGAKRASGCSGRWLEVGPLAWVCSDSAEMSPDERVAPAIAASADGMPFRYYFAGADGARAFLNLDRALDDAPDSELDPGFGVAVVEHQEAHGERWAKTRRGRWVALRELVEARPPAFHGEELDGALDVAWVAAERANVYASAGAGKPIETRARLQAVRVREEIAASKGQGAMVRVSEDGAARALWMRAKDLVRPTRAAPPDEVGEVDGATTDGTSGPRPAWSTTGERWIDVDLATQTLVAYEGLRPAFATLVSTGVGPRTSDTATPPGVHRIWVKLLTTNMDNLEREDAERHYSIEDVPWVMFFDGAVALHGVFWHRDFGRVRSHGCVNLAPLDARRLFQWTSPHLPAGWSAVYPTPLERGTVVRVR